MEQYGDAYPKWSAPFGNENQTVDRMHKDFDTFMGRQDCLSDALCRMQYYETCKKNPRCHVGYKTEKGEFPDFGKLILAMAKHALKSSPLGKMGIGERLGAS